jgi:hypothetical protein
MTSKAAMFDDKTLLGRARESLINSEKRVLMSTYIVFVENASHVVL